MKVRTIFFLKPVTVWMLFFSITIGLHAGTIIVTNTNDSGSGSLRQALADSDDGNTIGFSVTGIITLTSGELLVDKSISISGPGSDNLTVNGNGKGRVFYVGPTVTITISGLTITNGSVETDFGGGIYSDHSIVTMNSCEITDNLANIGGGIYSYGSLSGDATITLNNCISSGNSAVQGAGMFNYTGTVTINSSTFSNNSASNPGGGLYNFAEGDTATVTINNSTFDSNSAGNNGTGDGGAVNNDGVSGNAAVTITASTFRDNSTAGGEGGGIANFGFSGNATLAVSNSTFTGNSAIAVGGGIYNDGEEGNATVMLNNTTFGGNFADAAGDSIYNEGENGSAPASFANTIFQGGSAGNFFNNGGTFISLGYNISSDDGGGFLNGPGDQINTDPLLGPLQDNGGPTFTHELLKGSPAINAGDPSFTPPPQFDQRGLGFDRIVNGRLDIGSFEVHGVTPTPTPTVTPTPSPTSTPTITPTPTATPRPIPTPRPRPSPRPRPIPQ
jgi:hypothetical protein